jgi:hypothetical protein
MPYAVMITVPPIPKDDEEAWDWIHELDESLYGKEVPLSAELRGLITELVKTYPRYADLADGRKEDCVWAEEPLESNGHGRVLHIAFSGRHNIDPIHAHVVKVAKRLGLVVFDGQLSEIHRP